MRILGRPEGEPMERKKAKSNMKKVDIRLRVDAEFQKRIQELADRDMTTVAAIIRAAVIRDLKRIEKESAE